MSIGTALTLFTQLTLLTAIAGVSCIKSLGKLVEATPLKSLRPALFGSVGEVFSLDREKKNPGSTEGTPGLFSRGE